MGKEENKKLPEVCKLKDSVLLMSISISTYTVHKHQGNLCLYPQVRS